MIQAQGHSFRIAIGSRAHAKQTDTFLFQFDTGDTFNRYLPEFIGHPAKFLPI